MAALQSLLLVLRPGVLVVLLRIGLHGHGIMTLLHLMFEAWVDIAASEFLHPDRDDTARRNNPWFFSL